MVLGAVGFTSTGIAASSLAAKMMSAAAIANGGGVAAGSMVATLQSVGKRLRHGSLCQAKRTRASEDPAQILAPGIILGVWETEGAVGVGGGLGLRAS